MKFTSAEELINRRDELRQLSWEQRLNRFRSKEAKDFLWKNFDEQLGNWDFVLASEYYKLLKSQVRLVNKYIAELGSSSSGIEAVIGYAIETEAKEVWIKNLTDIYFSCMLDFTYTAVETMLPESFKISDDNTTFTPAEQEAIRRARRRKPRAEIVENGFHPRRLRGQAIPIDNTRYNRNAKKFVSQRLNTYVPDMSETMKTNLNTALRKAYDEATKKGLIGSSREKYIANAIGKSLGKKNLNRALLIARTEALALASEGQAQGVKEMQIVTTKEWITQRDGKVRDAHYALDGVEVDSMQGAPAGLLCNCRCSVVYHEKKV